MTTRDEVLPQVASLYYEQGLTQAQIARQVGVSRSTVSRAIQEARDSGLVEIIVHYPWKQAPEVEQALMDRYQLRQAKVLTGVERSYEEMLRGLGVLAARYLHEILFDGAILGISWGMAVYWTVRALEPRRRLNLTVVQMVGAVGEGDPFIDGPDLARLLASIYGGESRYLHAPLIVEDAHTRDVLLQEPRIRETLALARRADIALVGIGAPKEDIYSMLRAGYVSQGDLVELRSLGVVGDVCARPYDIDGQAMDLQLTRRIVGVELRDLRGIEYVVGVAGGETKAEAIVGALRGRHINVLVTDEAAARAVLAFG